MYDKVDSYVSLIYKIDIKYRQISKKRGHLSMENTLFVTADKVAADLGVSKPFAYKLVRQMNDELNKKGFLTVAGRVSRQYYEERFYGMKKEG